MDEKNWCRWRGNFDGVVVGFELLRRSERAMLDHFVKLRILEVYAWMVRDRDGNGR